MIPALAGFSVRLPKEPDGSLMPPFFSVATPAEKLV